MKSLFAVLACLTVLGTFGAIHAHAAAPADSIDCKNIDPNTVVKVVPGRSSKDAPAASNVAGKIGINK